MRTTTTLIKSGIATALLALAACASSPMAGGGGTLKLSGANEVPAVETSASAVADVKIAADGSVTGTITTSGMAPTMAHIHMGAVGTNGPVIVPMVQSGDVFTFPAGSKLNDAQMAAYKAGNLYLNVHSAKNPGGEVRAQLKPS
jgi:CHRD domain